MIRIVIGAAEQSIAYDLRAALNETEGVEVLYVVESTADLVGAVLRLDPDIILVHDRLGPDPVQQVIHDLALRKPACAALMVTLAPTAAQLAGAMDAGARGVVSYPLTLEELQGRITSAGDWAQQMRRMLVAGSGTVDGGSPNRGRLVALVGAKGGVGTTTIATHLALDVVRNVPGHKVCLIDLDLEKGDLAGVLEVRHRASIADVAKVAQDLSTQAVSDAVVTHETGLHLLLAPTELRDIEAVTPQALREVVAVLRGVYDLVIVDAGSHVTPAQAAVIELADEVVAVVTPDVLAMRGLRRAIGQWEGLGVRKESDVHVLVNRVSKASTVSMATVAQLTRAPVVSAGLPAMFRRLEPAVNARDPLEVREDTWWRTLRAIGRELGLVQRVESPRPDAATELTAGTRAAARRPALGLLGLLGGKGRPEADLVAAVQDDDRGQATIETVAALPILLVVLLLGWQLAVYGTSLVYSGRAASAAARAASVWQDPTAAARAAVPSGVADDLTVTTDPYATGVTVQLKVPILSGALGHLPGTITARRAIVNEP